MKSDDETKLDRKKKCLMTLPLRRFLLSLFKTKFKRGNGIKNGTFYICFYGALNHLSLSRKLREAANQRWEKPVKKVFWNFLYHSTNIDLIAAGIFMLLTDGQGRFEAKLYIQLLFYFGHERKVSKLCWNYIVGGANENKQIAVYMKSSGEK